MTDSDEPPQHWPRLQSNLRLAANQFVHLSDAFAATLSTTTSQESAEATDIKAMRQWIIYQDEALIVVSKPPNFAVHGPQSQLSSLARALPSDRRTPPILINNADASLATLLLFARDEAIAAKLTSANARGEIRVLYWALVSGPVPKTGMIRAELSKRREKAQEGQAQSITTMGLARADDSPY